MLSDFAYHLTGQQRGREDPGLDAPSDKQLDEHQAHNLVGIITCRQAEYGNRVVRRQGGLRPRPFSRRACGFAERPSTEIFDKLTDCLINELLLRVLQFAMVPVGFR